MAHRRWVGAVVGLALSALLVLALTGCTSVFPGLFGTRGGTGQRQVQALASDDGSPGDDGTGAEVKELSGRGKSQVVWQAFRDSEVRELARKLQGQGLRLNLWKAQAYEVTSTEESEAEAQALGMEASDDEGDETGTLVDVPLGKDGHLLQVTNDGGGYTWAEVESQVDGGEELEYIDPEGEAHFIIPDEETEQELLEALQQDPAYQELLAELQAQGASIADVRVVIDEDTGEAQFLVETTHETGAEGQWFGAGFRLPRIDGTYSFHFAIKRGRNSRVRFQPASPAVRRPVRELLEDRHSRTRLAVLYGGKRHETARLKRAVFFHEFIRHTKLKVDATKVWLGDIKDKRAFGKPDDPFTYEIRLKRAPWLKTKLQLELLSGCDSGDWVPKATQVVLPGQVEVAWKLAMPEWADAGLGYQGKSCKFRVRNLRNGRILGPWDGPKVFDPIAWRKWYQEQWGKGKVFDKALESHNILVREGAYGVVYAWDKIQGVNLLLAGFEDLNTEKVRDWINVAASLGQGPGTIDPRVIQALGILSSIDFSTLHQWLITLAKAIQEGNFDEVYNQLLQQGMDKLQQGFMLLDSQNPEEVKQAIHHMASCVAALGSEIEQDPPPVEVVIEDVLSVIWQEIYVYLHDVAMWSVDRAKEFADGFTQQLRETLEMFRGTGLLAALRGYIVNNQNMWGNILVWVIAIPTGMMPQPEFVFLQLIHALIEYVLYVSGNNPPYQGPQVLKELQAFLEWITQDESRLYSGFGTLWAAFNAMTSSWQIKGWLGPNGQPLQPGDPQAFMVEKGTLNDGRSVVAVVRGDACKDCGAEANIKDVTSWLQQALYIVGKPGNFRLKADQGVIVLAFTRNNPQGMDKIISALQNDSTIAGSDVPIIVAWRVGNTVYYKCIGNCNGLSPEDQAKIACDHVGKSCDDVQEYDGDSTSASDPSTPSDDSVTIYPPPPLNPDGSVCTQPPCIESEPALPVGS